MNKASDVPQDSSYYFINWSPEGVTISWDTALWIICSILHQIPYNIITHSFAKDFASISLITSTDKYMYFEGKHPIMLHMIFTSVTQPFRWLHGLTKDFILASAIVFLQAHDCFHGTRQTQCMYDHGCLVAASFGKLGYRSLWGQMQHPGNRRCAMWPWRHRALSSKTKWCLLLKLTDLPWFDLKWICVLDDRIYTYRILHINLNISFF